MEKRLRRRVGVEGRSNCSMPAAAGRCLPAPLPPRHHQRVPSYPLPTPCPASWPWTLCPQVSLNYLICKGAVPIPGAKNASQAAGNAGALGWRLSSGDVAELDELAIEGALKFGQHG
mgnify:CR=1 FL=1